MIPIDWAWEELNVTFDPTREERHRLIIESIGRGLREAALEGEYRRGTITLEEFKRGLGDRHIRY